MQTEDITFKIIGRDAKKLNEFQKLHDGCLEGLAGDRFSYSFSPTSLGMAITVSYSCGQKLYLGNFLDHDEKEIDLSKYGPLSKRDLENKKFEEDVLRILQMEDPRICAIASARKQTFDMIYFFAMGVACHSDSRISKSVLYSYSLDKNHHETKNYTGTEQENIELFFKYFKQKIREEIEKYDCENEALLKKLSS
ncbi:hypothetical protein [Oribacterium sp. FC2011]|uniref:hypothetical protein n=1 Tax=Oribacterium sp. FC2011 TaxID=1408311 RepID=UPI0004E20082|nr:hypothetical protein [Oribacterium sp. FC2011]